jgi:hypothetical protein
MVYQWKTNTMKIIDRTARKYFGEKYCYIVVIPLSLTLSKVIEWYKTAEYPYSYHSNSEISKKYKIEPRNGDKSNGYYVAFESEKLFNKIIIDLNVFDFHDVENENGIANLQNSIFKNINFDVADSI